MVKSKVNIIILTANRKVGSDILQYMQPEYYLFLVNTTYALQYNVRCVVYSNSHVYQSGLKMHMIYGPAFVEWYKNNTICTMRYYVNNALHNAVSAAVLTYYSNGSTHKKHFYQNDDFHNEYGPAVISYHPDGKTRSVEYLQHGELHRLDGPAQFHYKSDGSLWRFQHCHYGKFVNL